MSDNRSITVTAVVAIIISILSLCGRDKSKVNTRVVFLPDTTEVSKTEDGLWQSKANALELELEELKQYYQSEIDQIKRDFRVKEKNLKSMLNTQTETSDTIKVEVVSIDTVYSQPDGTKTFRYTDKWTEIEGLLYGDTARINYTITDSITFAKYWEESSLVIKGQSQNPNTIIKGIESISIPRPKRKKKFRVRPGVGVGLNTKGEVGVFAGVALTLH